MDRYTRNRGGSEIWTNKTIASDIVNYNFFGRKYNKFWVKISGIWKECNTFIKVSGIWKNSKLYFKTNGEFK